jgi:predicted RNA-binding Zn-ribbon protein involved in translation (DUF1610 family)
VNRVYNVSHKSEGVYYAVGGGNRTKAIFNYIYETDGDTSEFIHYRARLARDYEGKPIETENGGLLSMEELMPKGYKAWWECEECGEFTCTKEPFSYVPIEKYKCNRCGHIGNIPFAEV